ncbi:pimeloyl-ACP methyl ester carboxylesterase [Actinopolyspora biskrensis]|uniref:Pimeloyl-ACP methyl ester carboxylesterase n=1 Tax=Actinopolyspora biskrensis TaxID=1470178 RepID=A0A852Z9N3_9ACTN|nr:pimeloyl-ACP methyl ester carboxylesterase [Actinopolyspora biskrensis]
MRHHTIRGAELATRQSGNGDRELVFVHGFQNDHTGWRPLEERLDGDKYRSTFFDLAGCGASGGAETWRRCTIDEYGADLTGLCAELDIDRPVVVGHSLGGAIALRAVLDHPDRFAGLVLVAPASTTGLDFLPDEASFDALAHPTRDQQRAFARAAFRRPPSAEYLEELMGAVESASPEHIEGSARAMRNFTPRSELAAVDVPTLLVCGDRDRHVPLRNHLDTQRAIPRCGLQVYFDIGHVPFVEAPDSCAADIERFLATIA